VASSTSNGGMRLACWPSTLAGRSRELFAYQR